MKMKPKSLDRLKVMANGRAIVVGTAASQKNEFAAVGASLRVELRNGSAAGIVGPEAMVGTGQRAKINAKIASAQVRERLDVEQRFRSTASRSTTTMRPRMP
jgi:hypothetical protein